MKTKQQFLDRNGFDFAAFEYENEYSAKNILLAMDEYAKNQSIEFSEWHQFNGWERTPKRDAWVKERHENGLTDYAFKSTAELFDQFMLERIKK
jgi:hypothetical protein